MAESEPDRTGTGPDSVDEGGGLRIDDAYLEGATPDGPAMVGHLSVLMNAGGITVLGPGPGARRTVAWNRMSSFAPGPTATLPDGGPATTFEFVVDGRPLRLLFAPVVVPGEPSAVEAVATHGLDDVEGNGADVEDASKGADVENASNGEAMEDTSNRADSRALGATAPATADAPPAPGGGSVGVADDADAPAEHAGATEDATPEHSDDRAALDDLISLEADEAPSVHAPDVHEHAAARGPDGSAGAPEPEATAGAAAEVGAPAAPGAAESAPVDDAVGEVVDEGAARAPEPPEPAVEAVPLSDADDIGGDDPDLEVRRTGTPRAFARVALQQRPRRWRQVALVVILIALSGLAAGLWSTIGSSTTPAARPMAGKDVRLAASVGIRSGDLTGWQSQRGATGNAFAAGAGESPAASRTAHQQQAVLARCLHVPVSAVNGAFGFGSPPTPSGRASSPLYAGTSGDGSTVSSSVDVMQSVRDEQVDARVFSDPSLFAACYQPYAQAMLRYAAPPGTSTSSLSFASVEPVVVPPPPDGSNVQVAAFQIARIGNDKGQTVTVITTAIAIFGGRVQASLGTVSDFVFPLDVQNQLVHTIEARVIGAVLL